MPECPRRQEQQASAATLWLFALPGIARESGAIADGAEPVG
jgi:hypothetical protein